MSNRSCLKRGPRLILMNRNHLTDHLVFLAILLLIAIFLPGAAISATLEVCPSCPFSTVRAAVKYAYPHDAIVIQSGIYRDSAILIDKPLTLRGLGAPILDGLHQ